MRLDADNGIPLYLQLVQGLKERIAAGHLDGEIPASRDLAAELRVNYHTVARAYRELEEAGLLERQRGGAYKVAQKATARAASAVIDEAIGELCSRAAALGLERDDVIEALTIRWERVHGKRKRA
jgi:GntR family transcriptional regulator